MPGNVMGRASAVLGYARTRAGGLDLTGIGGPARRPALARQRRMLAETIAAACAAMVSDAPRVIPGRSFRPPTLFP